MSEIDTAMNLMFKSLQMANEGIGTALNIANLFIKPIDPSPENKMWNEAIEKGEVNVIQCHGEEKKKLIEELEKANIPYREYQNMLFVLKEDYLKIQGVIDSQTARPIETEMKEIGNGEFSELVVGTPEEALLVKSRLDGNNTVYAITQEGFGTQYKFVVSSQDRDNLDRAAFNAAIDNQGEYGKIIRRELSNDERYRREILETIGDTTPSSDRNYIVDMNGNSIISDRRSVTYEGHDNEILTERKGRISKKDDLTNIAEKYIDMDMPTKLSEEDYKIFKELESNQDRKDFIVEKRREQGIGKLTRDELEEVMKQEKSRMLIEQKLRVEHPSEIVSDANDYNNEQSLALFTESEKQNYEMNHDLASIGNIDATILNDALMDYRGYDIEESDVDYEDLANAETDIFYADERPDWLEDLIRNTEEQDQEQIGQDDQETEIES